MSEDKKTIELLEEINITLQEINRRLDTEEVFSESNKLIDNIEIRVEHSINQIQVSFDRIHDKVFNFNNIMIAAYMALGTFPVDSPILQLWTVIFPIINLIFLIFIEVRQMEIHRFAANEMKWTSKEREEFGERIHKQTLLSLGTMVISLGCLIYILICLFH
jgi:hypothetical protein